MYVCLKNAADDLADDPGALDRTARMFWLVKDSKVGRDAA
jgi:hypothetical protein